MKLGTIDIKTTAALAPMAGVADSAFRQICKEFGAAYLVSEMASSKGMHYDSKKTAGLLRIDARERPAAVQLFGDEPEIMAEAAVRALAFAPDIIDLNMGCPAPKIAGNGGGCALMKNPVLAGKIIEAVVKAVDLPVTVKFRKGWDDDSVNAVEFAKIAEASGAAAVTVHGRTRQQYYAPPVDLDIIAAVKQAVSIPVIGNGGCKTIHDVYDMYEYTKCDLVMIGQGALGAPWLFQNIRAYITGGVVIDPTVSERMRVMLRHARLACNNKGEGRAMREMRKHAAWYVHGLRGAPAFRKQAGELCTYADAERLAQMVIEKNR